MAIKIYSSANYVIVEDGANTFEYAKGHSLYTYSGGVYTIKEITQGEFKVSDRQIDDGLITNNLSVAYTKATFITFLRENTGFKTASGGSGATWGDITGTLSEQGDLQTALDAKQDDLVSGTNIKTINGNSVLGSGDLVVGGASNPSVIALSAVNGTTVNGLGGDTISQTLTIPANTFTGNGLLEVRYRMSKTVASGANQFTRIYVNTTNSLSGATLISQNQVSPAVIFQQITRTMRINSNTLTVYSGGLHSDFNTHTSAPYSATFNINQQQFLIFTMQLGNAGETGFVEFASAVRYI